MPETILNVPRRHFLAGLAAAGAGVLAPAAALGAKLDDARFRAPADDKWLDGLTGKYKQVFDMPNPTAGLGLIHIRNYLKAWKDTHNLEHPQVNAVGTLYYMTIPLGLTDPMWAKYKLGEAIKETDEKTGTFATRNIYWKADPGETTMSIKGIADWPADTSMEALQKKGYALHHVQQRPQLLGDERGVRHESADGGGAHGVPRPHRSRRRDRTSDGDGREPGAGEGVLVYANGVAFQGVEGVDVLEGGNRG